MIVSEAQLYYFSPTHTSKRVGEAVAAGLQAARLVENDLTHTPADDAILPSSSVAVVAVPVYRGSVAPLALGTAMQPDIPAGSIVLLKKWDVKAVVPGESYLIISAAFKGFRIIRRSEQADELLLLPRNAEEYDPISIKQSSIEKLFIVRGIIIKKIL